MRELEKILNLNPSNNSKEIVQNAKNALSTTKKNFDVIFHDQIDDRFNEDFETVRKGLQNLISEISDNVSKLSMIAQDTEKAAHFSALSQMITTLLNANKQMLEIYSEKKKYLNKFYNNNSPSENNTSSINVQNAIFTGTTADLKKWIEEANKSKV